MREELLDEPDISPKVIQHNTFGSGRVARHRLPRRRRNTSPPPFVEPTRTFPKATCDLGTVDAGVDRYFFDTNRPVFNEIFTTLRLRQRGRRTRMPAYRCRVRKRPVSAASIVVEDGRTCIGLEMCWRHTAAVAPPADAYTEAL